MSDDRLIVGLDLPDTDAARTMAALPATVSFYKLGLGLLASGGLDLAIDLKAEGKRVFLDLKLFDIGATITRAVRGITARLEPDFLTVHGDPQVVRAAVAGRAGTPTRILAVTILTSLDRGDLDANLIRDGALDDLVLERAARAFAAGADGVIASPMEATRLRALPGARAKLIVTPGVRAAGPPRTTKRTATPAAALAAGADYIVVARPIIEAADPAAARAILAEIA